MIFTKERHILSLQNKLRERAPARNIPTNFHYELFVLDLITTIHYVMQSTIQSRHLLLSRGPDPSVATKHGDEFMLTAGSWSAVENFPITRIFWESVIHMSAHHQYIYIYKHRDVCACMCVRTCVRTCVRACAHVCAFVRMLMQPFLSCDHSTRKLS